MSSAPPVAAGFGVLATGIVLEQAGVDLNAIGPTLLISLLVGVVVSLWRVATQVGTGLVHRHDLTPDSARAIGEHMGRAIGEALRQDRVEARELRDATDRLRRAVTAMPGYMQAEVAENHHDLVHAMTDVREVLTAQGDNRR